MRSTSAALGNFLIVVGIVGLVRLALGGTSAPLPAQLELTPIWQSVPTPTESSSAFRTAPSDAPPSAPARLSELDPPVHYDRAKVQVDDAASSELTPRTPTPVAVVRASTLAPVTASSALPEATSSSTKNRLTSALEPPQDAEPQPVDFRPITRVILPRIALAVDVVPAVLVEQDDGVSWMVPAFKAGHAQYTAGPGQAGNGILFGHVTSRSLGNAFEQLFRAHVGDLVEVFDGTERFDYRVVEVHAVSRTDVSVLLPTESASVSLITCTGPWNAVLHDYMERLVVRAELSD